ncbi:MAG: DUF1049 domain-containing protein [Kineosporiaceae bacterium]|nr:DUF1049 domain-containing protein [Aeromicrobium sp.]
MWRKSKGNASHGEPDTTASGADLSGHREPDEGHINDDKSPTVPDPVVQERRSPSAGFDSRGKVRRTRAGEWWAGLIVAAILAIALLIFIAQNSQKAPIHYFGFDGQISVAVALLFAAASGVLLVAVPGAVRIAQLRRALKKNAAADKS